MSGMSTSGGCGCGNGAVPVIQDPLIALITSYRQGMTDFIENAPEDDDEAANAYAESSYCLPMLAIENWQGPAPTKEGALAAVELAKESSENGDRSLVGPLLAAVAGYLKNLRY